MYQQTVTSPRRTLEHSASASAVVARSGQLDALTAVEQIGARRSFARDQELFAEGDESDCWFRVISGAVRICKWMPDGRRHVIEFCFAGDCFGLPASSIRTATAEAVGGVVVMCYPQRATDRLINETPRLVREMYDKTLCELTQAQTCMLLLGRMFASERVASFLLEIAERCDTPRTLNLTMSRGDIADCLGLTIETVCRTLSGLKRDGIIAVSTSHRIELRNREALENLCET